MLENTLTSLQEAMLQPGVRARTQRHLYQQVVALRIAQDDHFEEEEEFVLPIIRQRIAEKQQLEMTERLFIDRDAEDPRWILDWVAQDLTPTEQQVLAALVTRFAELPA